MPEPTSMTIRYQATRRDIWHAYWYTTRHDVRLVLLQLFIAGWFFYSARGWFQATVESPAWRLAAAAAVGALAFVAMALYPVLGVKTDERTLTISPAGIFTTIGPRRGDLPWKRIASVAQVGDRVYIVGRNMNSFAVPMTAFADVAERDQFVETATRWMEQARGA